MSAGVRAWAGPLYQTIFRSNHTWIPFIIGGAVITEFFTNGITNSIWYGTNKNVSGSSDLNTFAVVRLYTHFI
jgi:hypothetical protein